ncbi:MAG: hypothetical protein JWR80_7533 [Bradyrhizobium sp.]|nr:hypothetical protein [Bradyrhizobium sp.]
MDTAIQHAARHIYAEWHAGFTTGDLDRVMALYAEDAVIETPTVLSMYPEMEEGILHGRDAIRALFGRNLTSLQGTFRDLYRSGLYFANGEHLTWEYPRLKPGGGAQVDLFESIDIADGLIAYHRVYWGWRGMKALLDNRASQAGS